MTGAERLDACRDVGAIIRATADRDHEAAEVILDYSDNRAVAEILAILVVTACRSYSPDFLGDLCAALRSLGQDNEDHS